MGDEDLMETFALYTAWTNYAATVLAHAEVDEAKAQARVKYEEARVMVLTWESTDKVTVAKATRELTPEMQTARSALLVAYAARKMAGAMYGNCERAEALISRELTRRLGREGVERRSMRWNP
jgi:tellurite resistance protein